MSGVPQITHFMSRRPAKQHETPVIDYRCDIESPFYVTPPKSTSRTSLSDFAYICGMKQEIIIRGIEDLDRAAAEFLEKIGDNTLVAFFAPMGSGKTTFTTAICKALGVTDPVGSPTFAIVNEYMRADGEPMYHFDFYRINKLSEAVEIGLYDYLDSGCLCIMEWPENIEDLLPEETLKVSITVNPDQSRTVSWED